VTEGPYPPWTLGAFVEYAEAFGVQVETMPNVVRRDGSLGSYDYLWRSDTLCCALPMGYDPSRRIGPIWLHKTCRSLMIPPPPWPEAPQPTQA
jgi:hypothetical protein